MTKRSDSPGGRRRNHGPLSRAIHVALRVCRPLLPGKFTAATPIEVTHADLPFARLPEAFDGFRLALVSDLHYGRHVAASFVRRVVELVVQERPSLVLLGGDFVDRPGPHNLDLADLLADMFKQFPCYAVPGNHDYYDNFGPLWRNLRQAGLDLLINEHRLIGSTPEGTLREGVSPVSGSAGRTSVPPATIALAGLDDIDAGRPDFRAALGGIPPGAFTLLAGHSPDLADLAPPDSPVDLMLAGHTHGGQIRLWGKAVVTQTKNRRYVSGLVQGPGFPLYVSRGLGVTGLALRVGAVSELAILTLRQGQAIG